MAKTIGFNADEDTRLLAEALRKRLGYANTSEMLRDWLKQGIDEEIPAEEQKEIIRLFKTREGKKRNFTPSRRSGKAKAA
jgi:hypothetical protein